MGEALWIIAPLFLIGAASAALVRRRGGSWLATALAAFLSQAAAVGILFGYLLVAYNYSAMPNTPSAVLIYAVPRVLLLSLVTSAVVLALVRPIPEDARP
jgi:hypothetical protein